MSLAEGAAKFGINDAALWHRSPHGLSVLRAKLGKAGSSLYTVLMKCAASFYASADRDDETLSPRGTVAVKTRPATKKPAMYKVYLLNDDYTPMEFVVLILETFFNKSHEDANRIMLQVHQSGVGLCGIYTFEVAETKVVQVQAAARQAQHPLQCMMEKE